MDEGVFQPGSFDTVSPGCSMLRHRHMVHEIFTGSRSERPMPWSTRNGKHLHSGADCVAVHRWAGVRKDWFTTVPWLYYASVHEQCKRYKARYTLYFQSSCAFDLCCDQISPWRILKRSDRSLARYLYLNARKAPSFMAGMNSADTHSHEVVGGGALWSPSYFAGSRGGAPIEIVRQYLGGNNRLHTNSRSK